MLKWELEKFRKYPGEQSDSRRLSLSYRKYPIMNVKVEYECQTVL